MTHHDAIQMVEEIILPLPNKAELNALRKKAKSLKPPTMNDGDSWGNSRVGEFSAKKINNEELIVTWKTVNGIEKSADFSKLSSDPTYEEQRLELGWMIANMARVEAVRMLHAIPDPNEAMKQSELYGREENRWRYWAVHGS